MEELPFREGTKLYQTYQILSDQLWHCGKHELPGTQPAKAIQILRQHGYEIENRNMACTICGERTVFRRLTALSPTQASTLRQDISEQLRRRILKHYNHAEAITMRQMIPNQLEVDHRFPQVRWSEDEVFDPGMSDQELEGRFQLLTREHNLWKSRYCEHCAATNERGTFIGIRFFAEGGPCWDPTIPFNDERGCYGCFWFDPGKWRAKLNTFLTNQGPEFPMQGTEF